MFSFQTPADKLAAALAAYQKDFEKKLQSQPNPDAEEAKRRISTNLSIMLHGSQ
jgi:hypothetical protein